MENTKELYTFCIVVILNGQKVWAFQEAASVIVVAGCLLFYDNEKQLIKGLPSGEWLDFKRMTKEEAKIFIETVHKQNKLTEIQKNSMNN